MSLARRNLKSRGAEWAKKFANLLAAIGLTPNQVSVLSIVFAALSSFCFYKSSTDASLKSWYLVAAALFIQLRLLCNLMDGMLAIEHKKKSAIGDLFNEVPDRIADVLILVGVGFVAQGPVVRELSWLVAVLAVGSAYIRLLGGALGVTQYFLGPMAKQHRMALTTFGTFLAAATSDQIAGYSPLYITLVILCLGTIITCYRRLVAIARDLKARAQ